MGPKESLCCAEGNNHGTDLLGLLGVLVWLELFFPTDFSVLRKVAAWCVWVSPAPCRAGGQPRRRRDGSCGR